MTFNLSKDLHVDDKLRKELAKPFGTIMQPGRFAKEVNKNERIYAVGDVTVATLIELGYSPRIAIFDYKTERRRTVFKSIKAKYKRPLTVRNGRGTLSVGLWKAVGVAALRSRPSGIRVLGEEDLASLACIHFAHAGEKLVYGLKDRGIAVITVNAGIKKYVDKVLKRMSGI